MNEEKLRSDLKELNSIRNSLLKILFSDKNKDPDNYTEELYSYKELRSEIHLQLAKEYKVPVIVDPVLRKELQEFFKHGDSIIHNMKKKFGNNDLFKELDNMLAPEFDSKRLDEVADSEFLSWFNQYDYVNRLINTAIIIVKSNELPKKLHRLINELRNCLMFENYLAAGIMLRTITEVAVDDVLIKNFSENRFISLGEKLDFLESRSAYTLPASSLNAYRKDLNDYVHGNKLVDNRFINQYAEIILDQVQEMYEKSE